MGWWGYEPWQSDQYWDTCAWLFRPRKVRKAKDGHYKRGELLKAAPTVWAKLERMLDSKKRIMDRYVAVGIILNMAESKLIEVPWIIPLVEKAYRVLIRCGNEWCKDHADRSWFSACQRLRYRFRMLWHRSGKKSEWEIPDRIWEEERPKRRPKGKKARCINVMPPRRKK